MFIVQMRTLVWVILSNLFLVEYLFSLQAYTSHIGNLSILNSAEAVLDIVLFTIPIKPLYMQMMVLSLEGHLFRHHSLIRLEQMKMARIYC